MKKQITIGVGEAATTAKEFIDAWKAAERGESVQAKHRLHFENLELLLKTLTPGRWALLKKLHANDVRRLENIGLIERTKNNRIKVPWDIVEARLLLAA